MDNEEFFESVLPESGWYCAAVLTPTGKFAHSFWDTKEELYSFLLDEDAIGHTVYFAQASFKAKGSRTQENVKGLKCFFLDIDCGEDKPYKNQEEGLRALASFITASSLPSPSVVSSGNGLYAYWILGEEIDSARWKNLATRLKDLVSLHGFQVDLGLTADSARVLRPVGSHNRKKGAENEVRIIRSAGTITAEDFEAVVPVPNRLGVVLDFFKEFEHRSDREFKSVTSDEVAANCAFMAHVKKERGNVPEPVWYNCLGVLNCCVDRDTAIHQWSDGHPAYSKEETERKARQWEGKGCTSCRKLQEVAPELCEGCKQEGTHPIGAGRTVEVKEGVRCKQPWGFFAGERGVISDSKKLHSREIRPVSVGHDYTLGHEVAVFSVHDKFEGWRKIRLRTAHFNDSKSCLMSAADQGLTLQGGDAKQLMVQFLEGYINSLKTIEQRSKFCAQMGWQSDTNGELIFVLGDTIYKRDGEEQIGLAGSVSDVAKNFRCEGFLEEWVRITKSFDTQGIEPLAFEFLTLAFGAPLMYFTGYSGAMVSAKGAESGVGKTMSGQWGLSAYGPPKKLELHQNDTQNALVSRLGVCNTLPIYIDEITEMRPEELSNLVYRITDGRDKLSLTSRREERSGQSWCTIAVVTANNGVVDKLGGFKPDASAQINRVFEYTVKKNPKLTVDFWKEVVPVFTNNFGHAGVEFARCLAAHQDEHKKQIQAYINFIHERVGAYPEERFWVAILAATFYGAAIAKKLGLIRFDIAKTVQWAMNHIPVMRVTKSENTTDAPAILASYIGENMGSILAVDAGENKIATVLRDPNRGLIGRYEKNAGMLWISQKSMKDCFKIYGYSRAKTELTDNGMLVETSQRKVLGIGTKYGLGAGQDLCWVIKADDKWLDLREKEI